MVWSSPDASVAVGSSGPAVTTSTFVTVVWAPPGRVDTMVDVLVEWVGAGVGDFSSVVPADLVSRKSLGA